ncbi:MAG: metallophosphoesterase [Nitrospiraceae bacterium]|nr:MAG: metallophosphoesterase [Nitrospiraceae bacterium]
MKIGIISDSHDHLENIQKSVKIFKEKNVAYVLHLGDFINPNSIRAFRGINLIGVFGNNDGDKFRLMAAFHEISGEIKGDFYEFEADDLKFACYHGTEPQITDALIACQEYDVVLFGHTHQSMRRAEGKTLLLNPGTAHGFGESATIMIFDTVTQETELIEL